MKRWWLAPLVPAYAAGVALRNWRIEQNYETVRRLQWPVVSIGNLSTGGAGKTPLTIALARALKAKGYWVDVLSRGYGRTGKDAERVQVGGSAEHFGDEPLLIARAADVPVYVARERYEAGVLAEREDGKPGVHLLDDGFQHRQLARDVEIVLLNREDWRDGLLPAGNLREPIEALQRADVLAIPAEDDALEAELRAWGWKGCIWRVQRGMETPPVDGTVLTFCGIARPEQFFAGLEAAGVQIAARMAYRDHHRYTAEDLARLVVMARARGVSALVTTEKDLARLGKLAEVVPKGMALKTVKLRVVIEDEAGAVEWLAGRVAEVLRKALL